MFFDYFLRNKRINSLIEFCHQQAKFIFTRGSIQVWSPVLLSDPTAQRTPRTIAHVAYLYLVDHWSRRFYSWCSTLSVKFHFAAKLTILNHGSSKVPVPP